MNIKTYQKLKFLIVFYASTLMAISVYSGNILLGLIGVISGLIFLTFLKRITKQKVEDERTEQISLRAYKSTYLVLTSVLLISSILLITFGVKGRVEATYVTALGIILSYITIFIVLLYSLFFYYFSKKI